YQWNQAPSASLAQTDNKTNNEITVKKGAKTKLQLPDGSQVWVNSDSKLSYPASFQGGQRDVYLEGEAYFDVVKDPKHPFIVHTSGIDVRVLGTAFNVKAYEAEPTIEATLVHGMIEVTKINEPTAPKVILKHHEKLIYNKFVKTTSNETLPESNSPQNTTKPAITIAQIAKQTPDSAFLETAWVYNRLRFEDERMDELAMKMERWFDVNIRIDNDKLKAYRLTGSFENETIEDALKAMQYLVSFKYSIENRNVVITK
ncbi:MAG TPA: FecR family protein, partial [Ferruginibacter sp.]|nr:FecR family protein [Ferruginibacter sp.]